MSKSPIRSTISRDGSVYRNRWTQPGESEILKENLRLQHESTRRRSDFMAPVARVPEIVQEKWRREGREDLARGDRRAMEKFLNSSEGRAYRTSPKGRSRPFSAGGLKRG